MPKPIDTVADVFLLWPSSGAMARNLGLSKPSVIRKWKTRGAIPETYWHAVCRAAKKCGFGPLTYAQLAELHRA